MSTTTAMNPTAQKWTLIEDEALKRKVSGIVVPDKARGGTRPVGVFFRLPEDEFRRGDFPLLTIDLVDISRAVDREHRGYTNIGYYPANDPRQLPDPLPTWETDNTNLFGEYPIPYNLDYQITSWARLNRDSRLILAALAGEDKLHRAGYLEVPEDGTIRSLDLLAGPVPDDLVDPENKRLFRNVWSVRVYTELLPSQIDEPTRVGEVNVTLEEGWEPTPTVYDSLVV